MKRKEVKNMDRNKHTEKGKSVCGMTKNDWKCLLCNGWYSQSAPEDEWIQCPSCLEWAHYCTNGDDMFRCEKCRELTKKCNQIYLFINKVLDFI